MIKVKDIEWEECPGGWCARNTATGHWAIGIIKLGVYQVSGRPEIFTDVQDAMERAQSEHNARIMSAIEDQTNDR